ncbi:MAG: hypothetical protein QF464_06695, partial [Myxococcota bacterium]|nr:hypothetical protein [Myxococcota bacterium]
FIMTYGFLNLSCAIESWASTDFRPDFKIPGFVPLLGTIICVVVMIQLDAVAMVAATALMAGIFLYLERRELSLESGDTWEGVWSLVVRSGLQRLHRGTTHPRNWSPNVLLFDHPEAPDAEPLRRLGQVLVSRRGVLTEFELTQAKKGRIRESRQQEPDPDTAGIFHRRVDCEDPYTTIAAVCRYHGFSGVEPNTVLMGWSERSTRPEAFRELLVTLEQQDLNLLLMAGTEADTRNRIDIWWGSGTASDQLALLVARFLTTSDDWRRVPVRFLVVNDNTYRADALVGVLKRLLGEMRVLADIHVVGDATSGGDRAEIIRQESTDAALTVLPVTQRPWDDEDLAGLVNALGHTLLIRGAPSLDSPAPNLELSRAELPNPTNPTDSIAPLRLPSVGVLGEEVARFDAVHRAFVASIQERGLAPLEIAMVAAVEDLRKVALRALAPLDKTVGSAHVTRRRRAVARAQGAFLFQSSRRIQEFQEQELDRCFDGMRPCFDGIVDEMNALASDGPAVVDVVRAEAAYAPNEEDSRALASVKRQLLKRTQMANRPVPYQVSVGKMRRYTVEYETLAVVQSALARLARGSYRLSGELVALMGFVRQRLATLSSDLAEEALTTEGLEEERAAISARFDELLLTLRTRFAAAAFTLYQDSRRIVQTLANDLDRLDVEVLARKERKVPRASSAEWSQLTETVDIWRTNLGLVLRRVSLSLSLGAFHQRLGTVVDRARSGLVESLERDAIPDFVRVVEGLEAWHVGGEEPLPEVAPVGSEQAMAVDERVVMDSVVSEIYGLTSELPERLETLGELTLAHLDDDPFEDGKRVTLDVRRRVEVQLEGTLMGELRAIMSQAASSHQRALSVGRDVVRLVAFDATRAAVDDDPEGSLAQRETNLERGVERVRVELAALRQLLARVDETFRRQLQSVVDRTGPHAVLSNPRSGGAGSDGDMSRWLPTFTRLGRRAVGLGRSV